MLIDRCMLMFIYFFFFCNIICIINMNDSSRGAEQGWHSIKYNNNNHIIYDYSSNIDIWYLIPTIAWKWHCDRISPYDKILVTSSFNSSENKLLIDMKRAMSACVCVCDTRDQQLSWEQPFAWIASVNFFGRHHNSMRSIVPAAPGKTSTRTMSFAWWYRDIVYSYRWSLADINQKCLYIFVLCAIYERSTDIYFTYMEWVWYIEQILRNSSSSGSRNYNFMWTTMTRRELMRRARENERKKWSAFYVAQRKVLKAIEKHLLIR